MSTPFPLEDAAQRETSQYSDPWSGPTPPSTFTGMGFNKDTYYLGPFYRMYNAAESASAKGVGILSGAWNLEDSAIASGMEALNIPGASLMRSKADEDARLQQTTADVVKASTPDPATTGSAVQLLHGFYENAILATAGGMAGGPLAAGATVGVTQGKAHYDEVVAQGVKPDVAASLGAIEGLSQGVGAMMPGGFGSSLATRLASGALSNVGFGFAARYEDHAILEDAGYHEMADQQKVWDKTQIAADAALGAIFGGAAHLHAKAGGDAYAVQDAARVTNLALRDRALAPGVAADPGSAAVHNDALEKATSDLFAGRPVDVSGTRVAEGNFVARPERDLSPVESVFRDAIKESGLFDEQANLKALDDALAGRLRGEKLPVPEPVQFEPKETQGVSFTTAKGSSYEVTPGGTTIRNKAPRPEHPGESGPQPESELTFYVKPEDAEKLGEIQTQGGPGRVIASAGGGSVGVRYEEGPDAGKFERRTVVPVQGKPAVGLTPVELWKGGKSVHFGNSITEVRGPGQEGSNAVSQSLAQRPDLQIVNEDSKPVSAAAELARTSAEADQAGLDAPTAVKAAVDCAQRRGAA